MVTDSSMYRNSLHRDTHNQETSQTSSKPTRQVRKRKELNARLEMPPVSAPPVDESPSRSLRSRARPATDSRIGKLDLVPVPRVTRSNSNGLSRSSAVGNLANPLTLEVSLPHSFVSASTTSSSTPPKKRERSSTEKSETLSKKVSAAAAETEVLEQEPMQPAWVKDYVEVKITATIEKNRAYAVFQQMQLRTKKFKVDDDKPFPNAFRVKTSKGETKVVPINLETGSISNRNFAVASCQGVGRISMEDESLIHFGQFKINDQPHPFELYAVFDGHGGKTAALFAKSNLATYLVTALEDQNPSRLTINGIYRALEQCCINLDHDYRENHGTTLIMAVIIEEEVWIANVGDSRAFLFRDGEGLQVSEDALPKLGRYQKEIIKLGGKVNRDPNSNIKGDPIYRVNDNISVARAIGDKHAKGVTGECCILPNPTTLFYTLEKYEYLVIACDGLFDVASTNDVAQAIAQMNAKGKSTEYMSGQLVYQAIKHGSKDNVTVMVIKLRSN